MAKININFNNANYLIDESSLPAATAALKSHLSTVMNGSGAMINLGGASYNIDSAKLSAATNAFVAHLGTIAGGSGGSGSKVTVNGVEYSIDPTKVSGAVAELETVLGGLNSAGGNSGGGQGGGCDTLYWDGNTEGLTKILDGYKVSSAIVPNNMLLGCKFITTIVDAGETTIYTTEIDSETYDSYVDAGYITEDYAMLGPYVIMIRKQNVNIMGTVFADSGLYLYCSNEGNCTEYISYINVPGYTGFPHSENCGH